MENTLYCPQCKKPLEKAPDKYVCKTCSRNFPITDGIPQFVLTHATLDSFDPKAFDFLFQMEKKHFWHVGRREIILDTLLRLQDIKKAKILEIGCGNGSVTGFLKENDLNIEGGDMFMEGLKFCRERAGNLPLYQIDILSLPFINEYEIIGLFDVLEHIKEDGKALSAVCNALKPGGKLLLTVPAHKIMWNHVDEVSGHQRRYSKKELISKLQNSGFKNIKISYYVSFLFPPLLIYRLLAKIIPNKHKLDYKTYVQSQTVPVVNEIFLWIMRLEKLLLRYINLPAGASLVVIAEKK